ncbi:glycerol dehydrogenase [Aeromicrobium sp. CF4.19]|uniref:glycerol dehydrogenase n=1 Tax=Aeromicrobium sp. CF4.19 TaxID=3373082 RepID=UPI003EE6DC57
MTTSTSARIAGFPHRYVQGSGVLDAIGEHVSRALIGGVTDAAIVIDSELRPRLEARITTSLMSHGVAPLVLDSTDEVTHQSVNILADAIRSHISPRSVVVGIGGGKTIDRARAAAHMCDAPLVTVPTIASNDSPAAMAVALYGEDHQLVEVLQTGHNPSLVLVDTALVASAPARLLSAGIGDAISKKFEAAACATVGGLNSHGTTPLITGLAIANACYDTLREHGAEAVRDVTRGTNTTDAIEATVEATVLMSGLAFENGGLSIAHSMTRGLQAIPPSAEGMHGEHVAYGLLVQRAHERVDDDELEDLRRFLTSVNLPIRLGHYSGTEPTADDISELVDRTMNAPHTHKSLHPVSPKTLREAVDRVERRE